MCLGVTQLTLGCPQDALAETGGPDFSRGENPDQIGSSAPTEVGATHQHQANCVTPMKEKIKLINLNFKRIIYCAP